MEKSTPIGLGLGFLLIYGAIFMGDGWITFFDPGSLILVVGGTVAALIVTFSFDELKMATGGLKGFFGFSAPPVAQYVEQFTELSRTARREGLLALDREIQRCDDPFMRFGLEMAVDGIEDREIDDLMQGRMATEAQKRQIVAKLFTNAGMYCPAFGMVGTLIGLVQMMQNLTDPSAIGAGMAVAMITTFYGALLSNLLFLPCATKAKAQTAAVILSRQVVRTGVLSIVRGESPSMVEKRLRLFLDEDGEDVPDNVTPIAKAA